MNQKTCKDCIHYDVCIWDGEIVENSDNCSYHKDKSRIVELPCKVGDDVYCLAGSNGNKIEKDECIGYYIKPEQRNLITEVRVVSAKGNYGTYGVIGESFFLTREEAEKALERMKEDEKNNI